MCWASGWIIGRGLASEIPPMAMTFFRWVSAMLILAPFALRPLRHDWPRLRECWKPMLGLGVLGVGIHNALAYLGLNYTTAANGVILNSFAPVLIVAFSRIFLGDRLTPLQAIGVGVSLCGILMLLSHGSLDALLALRFNIGDLLILLAVAMWAVYTICLRWRPSGLDNLSFLFVLMCVGDAAVLPLWLGEMALGRHVHWTLVTSLALLALGLFSSVLPYLFWHEGVERIGASVAGLFTHLIPVFGTLMAWVILDEQLHVYHFAGFALILGGIYMASRFRKSAAAIAADAAPGEAVGLPEAEGMASSRSTSVPVGHSPSAPARSARK